MFLPQDRVLFGAAYYFEYQPTDTLKVDLDLMVDAGFNTIRVGESVWSTWEPDEGIFDLDWLQPVLDAAHARGLSAILGTPTYAVPPWLARLYPEINAERPSGQRIGWGARQEVDYTTNERPGTIVVDTRSHYLYFIEPGGKAMRYGVGLGAAGYAWHGRGVIQSKQKWPRWTPPAEMIARLDGRFRA